MEEISLMITQRYKFKCTRCKNSGKIIYVKGLVNIWWCRGGSEGPFWVRCLNSGGKFHHHRKYKGIVKAINNINGEKFGPTWRKK